MIGKDETREDKLRSILAQKEYTYTIRKFAKEGIPFDTYVYVPERHPCTEKSFHEREDCGHLLKVRYSVCSRIILSLQNLHVTCHYISCMQRVAQGIRKGHHANIDLCHFVEALKDDETGLSYAALTGVRKQSVRDAENLFSSEVAAFMKKNNYQVEEEFIPIINNWRRACDERGLSEDARLQYHRNLVDHFLKGVIPWYAQQQDLSLLEVNQ